MATRFVRVDLSDEARDYRPLAIEPGVPMLDKSNANAKILFRWIGGMAAEPVWDGESVNFFVRDNRGGRLEEVICQPASEQRAPALLQDELSRLKDRLDKAPRRHAHGAGLPQVAAADVPRSTQHARPHGSGQLLLPLPRPGEPLAAGVVLGLSADRARAGTAVVCTDPDCACCLFAGRERAPSAPVASTLQFRPVHRARRRGLLLALVAAGGGRDVGMEVPAPRLVAVPGTLSGPVGSRCDVQIMKAGLFSKVDVTGQAVGVVLDPAVARFDQMTGMVHLVGPGGTKIRFQMGALKTEITLEATVMANPEKITIEPHSADLGVGTTARLKLIGEYKDGTKADLTAAAEWKPQNDKIVFAMGGFLEGLAPGASTISARYRATPDSHYMEATANVGVSKIDVKSLAIAVEPLPVGVGRGSRLHVERGGRRRQALLAPGVVATEDRGIGPSYLASVHGSYLRGNQVGRGQLSATFGDGPAATKSLVVASIPGIERLEVHPDKLDPREHLDLVVGEIADLSIVSPSTAPVRLSSSKPGIVEITSRNRLIGRHEGVAEVEVAQGSRSRTVEVGVSKAEFQSIAIDPGSVVAAVDDAAYPRVVARVKGNQTGREVELAPDLLACDKAPSPRFADFNAKRMELRGIMPTDKSFPQTLAMRFAALAAKAPVEVVVAPLRLELTPAGPVDLPLGQMARAARLGPLQRPAAGRRPRPAIDLADRQDGQAAAGHRAAGR